MSTFSQGIRAYAPRKSAKVVTLELGKIPAIQWDSGGGNSSHKRLGLLRQIATLAKEAERCIATQAEQVSETAVDILEATLDRKSM
jgi:hypothetical protein